VLLEGAVIGVLASVAGLALGVALADGLSVSAGIGQADLKAV
jgi:hypothetical protein